MAKGQWTPDHYTYMILWTSHSKTMGINMELDPPLRLWQLPLFWEGFPFDFGVCLWEFVLIQQKEHFWVQELMLDEKAWLTIGFLIPPKCVQWGWGQGSVQANRVPPHQTRLTMCLWTLLCAQVHSHAGTAKGLPQTVATKLEAGIG